MISARRLALLGFNAPLSAIMVAVLGIWPREDDEETLPDVASFTQPGGRGRRIEYRDLPDDDDITEETNELLLAIAAAAMEMYA